MGAGGMGRWLVGRGWWGGRDGAVAGGAWLAGRAKNASLPPPHHLRTQSRASRRAGRTSVRKDARHRRLNTSRRAPDDGGRENEEWNTRGGYGEAPHTPGSERLGEYEADDDEEADVLKSGPVARRRRRKPLSLVTSTGATAACPQPSTSSWPNNSAAPAMSAPAPVQGVNVSEIRSRRANATPPT